MTVLNRLSFKWQISLFFTMAIIVMLAITSWVQYLTAENSLRTKQIDQGLKMSRTLADQSALAILYNTEENAREAMQSMLDFPDVVAVEIYRPNRSLLAFAGEEEFRTGIAPEFNQEVGLESEDDRSWRFLSPVVTYPDIDNPFGSEQLGESTLGYVRLTLSKKSLNETAREHLFVNVLATTGLGAVFMVLLLVVAARLTKPIRELVDVMERVQSGERQLVADASGSKDIHSLADSFNNMNKARDEEEIAMRVSRDIAEETVKMKGEFTGKVTHELRTPLNGIIGTIDLIEDEGGLSPKQTELIGIMHNSATLLHQFINDILDFSKADAGALELLKDDFYILDVAQSIIDLQLGEATRKDIGLGIIMALDLPDLVHGDSGKIRQILTNLVGNAIKFTDAGEVALKIELVEQLDRLVTYRFMVEDTGIGIPNDVLNDIFEPFTQADTGSSRRYSGTGLGLTIAHQLVDLMGGTLNVTSTVGVGSKFSFTVPFEIAQDDIRTNIEKYRPEVAGLRILVVDDSSVNRSALTTILDPWDTYYQTCPEGKTALLKLRQAASKQKQFDFVIIDQQLKSMDYERLVSNIVADPELNKTRIIMTWSANKLGKSEALELGVSGTVDRPVRDTKLYQCITSIMNASDTPSYLGREHSELIPLQRRILVVEDTTTNQIVVEEILTRLGCVVEIAQNGQDAIDNYFHKPWDLILMDCRMPIVDGYQATKIYRSEESQTKHTPIIAMTANTEDDESREKVLDAGMDDYLPKPLSMNSVKSILSKWLNKESELAKTTIGLYDETTDSADGLHHISRKVFGELVEAIDEKAVRRMIQSFSLELPDKLDALEAAIHSEDRKSLVEIAHSLKSSAQNFGAENFSETAKLIEQSAHYESLDVLENFVLSLQNSGSALEVELKYMLELQEQLSASTPVYRILIAEDNESEKIALCNSLKNKNLIIDTVVNGSEAIEYCKNNLPDLVLMDALMPETENPVMDGFVACRTIKQLPDAINVPVLMVTGLNDQDSIKTAMEAGSADFISKPINYTSLQRRVKNILTSSHSERQIQKIAYTDALTGLPNRAHYVDKTAQLIKSTQENTITAIVFVGLDQFSLVNKAIGHHTGDLLLQTVAKRLKLLTSENVFAARTGGDEFSFVLQGFDDQDEVEVFAQLIRDELSSPYHILHENLSITATLGISMYPLHGQDISLLMKRADTAMFHAKEKKLPYLLYEEGMGKMASNQLKVLSSLPEAIHNDQLSLVFQPQHSVAEERIDGCEALVRWNTSQNGVLPPDTFLGYAEESGIIIQLGEWVILNACKQLSKWRMSGLPPIHCAINLSAKQLEEPNLTDRVAEVLNATGIEPSQIEFEITESALMQNTQQCLESLTELKNMGFRIAIDDFGTGYNTFVHLDTYPIDIIKIDRRFISTLSENGDSKVVQGILSVAQGMSFTVVAEGVETEFQQQYLIEHGCHYLQGFLIGKPVTAAVFEQTILRKQLRKDTIPNAVTPISHGKEVKDRRIHRKLN